MSDYEQRLERARELIEKARVSLAAYEDDLTARDAAVNTVLKAAPDGLSDNELARRLGLESSTFRSITDDLRKERRRRRRRGQ